MTQEVFFKEIDGIKCYNPEVCEEYKDYFCEGFDLTHQLESKSFWCRSRNRLLKSLLLKLMKPEGKTKFLEVGCATGSFLKEISAISTLSIVGSDVYLQGLQYAKAALPRCDFIQLDLTAHIPIKEQFDIIGAFDVIEHLDNDVTALRNLNQLLKLNGYVIITVPQYQFLWSKLDVLVKHKRRYSRTELIAKVQAAGFKIHYISSFLFLLFPLMLISRLVDKVTHPADKVKEVNQNDELKKRVNLSKVSNLFFDKIMRIDEFFINRGFSLPVGGTLVVIAQKSS